MFAAAFLSILRRNTSVRTASFNCITRSSCGVGFRGFDKLGGGVEDFMREFITLLSGL